MTIAQVQSHVITQREVKIHQLVNKTLGSRLEGLDQVKPVEQVVREWLLFYEASNFYNTELDGTKYQKELSNAQNKLAKSKLWQDLGVTKKELQDKIKRRLEAERLYLFKKKASILPVSRVELETEYTQNKIKYGNLTYEQVESQIRNNKVKENLSKRLNQWFTVLENKYKVQRFSKAVME